MIAILKMSICWSSEEARQESPSRWTGVDSKRNCTCQSWSAPGQELRCNWHGNVTCIQTKTFVGYAMNRHFGYRPLHPPRTVKIKTHNGDARLLRGTDVVINTGTTPALPDLPGVAESAIWTSETILQLGPLPPAAHPRRWIRRLRIHVDVRIFVPR